MLIPRLLAVRRFQRVKFWIIGITMSLTNIAGGDFSEGEDYWRFAVSKV